jgi:hypothetical protein
MARKKFLFAIPSQATSLKRLRHNLPDLPVSFNPDKYALEPRFSQLIADLDGYRDELKDFLFKAYNIPDSPERAVLFKDEDSNNKYVARLLDLVNEVKSRCIHHSLNGKLYASKECVVAMRIYWQLATILCPKDRALNDEEYLTAQGEMSRFFTKTSRVSWETQSKQSAYYDCLQRFLHEYPWGFEVDKRVFAAFVEGFQPDVISIMVERDEKFVRKKIEKYKEIALENFEELRMARD